MITTYDGHRSRLAFHLDSFWGGEYVRAPSSPTLGRAELTQWAPVRVDGRDTGDFQERVVASFASYLVPHPGESVYAFKLRMSLACYVNLVQPIVDAYVDAVTSPVVRDLGPLAPYLSSLDGRGRTWADHVEEVARWSAVYGYCATVIDVPVDNPSTSLADEETRGVSLRATIVHPTAFAWVKLSDDGELDEFAFVETPYLPRENGTQVVRFWVYGRETFAVYECEITITAGYASAQQVLPSLTPLRSGPLPAQLSGRVPVVFSYFRQDTSSRAPRGISLVGDVVDLARQIYNELSWIEEIHRKTAFPFLAVPEPSQGAELDPSVQVKLGPDSAFGYNSATGSPAWVQPSADSTRELREHALFLAAVALRTTGLEVSSSDSSPDASGEALKVRSRDFDSRCARFARSLAGFEREALGLASLLTGGAAKPVVTYPKRFVLPSPADDLARAILLVQTFGDKLGSVGYQAAVRAALDAALALSDEQLAAIMDDVRASAETQDAMASLQAEHATLKAAHTGAQSMLAQVLERNKRGELVTGSPLAPKEPTDGLI